MINRKDLVDAVRTLRERRIDLNDAKTLNYIAGDVEPPSNLRSAILNYKTAFDEVAQRLACADRRPLSPRTMAVAIYEELRRARIDHFTLDHLRQYVECALAPQVMRLYSATFENISLRITRRPEQ